MTCSGTFRHLKTLTVLLLLHKKIFFKIKSFLTACRCAAYYIVSVFLFMKFQQKPAVLLTATWMGQYESSWNPHSGSMFPASHTVSACVTSAQWMIFLITQRLLWCLPYWAILFHRAVRFCHNHLFPSIFLFLFLELLY